ncbi:MAG: hypothetical protein ACKVU2_09255 [Saprospiraceae bacterium]
MEQSEEVAAAMRQMLAQNAAAAEAVTAGARSEFELAAAKRVAARQALLEAQKNTEKIRSDFFKEHEAWLEADARKQTTCKFAERLLRASVLISDVAALLDAPDGLVAEVAQTIGYVKIKPTGSDTEIYAWAAFEGQGRGGYITLHWGRAVCRFWYEGAISPALLLLEIPREENWEAQTAIPLAQRQQALRFMGERMVRYLAPECEYRIEVDSVVLFK